jgi:hypothetical protein
MMALTGLQTSLLDGTPVSSGDANTSNPDANTEIA